MRVCTCGAGPAREPRPTRSCAPSCRVSAKPCPRWGPCSDSDRPHVTRPGVAPHSLGALRPASLRPSESALLRPPNRPSAPAPSALRPAHLVFGLEVGPGRDERSDGLRAPSFCSTVQGRPPILRRRERGGAGGRRGREWWDVSRDGAGGGAGQGGCGGWEGAGERALAGASGPARLGRNGGGESERERQESRE